jgi:putative acetyltransferase
LYSLFQTPKSQLWVAEAEDKIVGCCGIFPTENLPEGCTELVKFYISNEGRGKGIGRLLLEKTIETAQELGYSQIYLESIPEFSTAVSIYEKQGFQYLNQPLGNTGHDGCNLWMLKEMSNEQ